jgi:hypothetical protein
LSSIAVSRPYALSLTGVGEAEQVNNAFISSDFFTVLGVKPLLGRTFVQGEDEIGAAPVALVSEGFWKRKLGSAPDVVGKSLTLDGRDYKVVGVISPDFHLFHDRDLYVPIGQWNNPILPNRGAGLGMHGKSDASSPESPSNRRRPTWIWSLETSPKLIPTPTRELGQSWFR